MHSAPSPFLDVAHVIVVGVLVCLEEGCGRSSIPLSRSNMDPDGGKKAGVGSLMPYRVWSRKLGSTRISADFLNRDT